MSTLVTDVEGSYENERSGPFQVGLSSGSSRIGLGVSNQLVVLAAAINNTPGPQYIHLGVSLTPDQAETIGRALIEHADKVRSRA